jgi:FMN reductase
VGSPNRQSTTRTVLLAAAERLSADGVSVDLLDLSETLLPMFNPDSTFAQPHYSDLKTRVEKADVYLLGTPDYHGCLSGALKNFLDHFWTEFAGKLFASIVASHDKGLTVTDQLRTMARQCYAWSLPYAVCVAEKTDVKEGQIIGEAFQQRLHMMIRDLQVYGQLLAAQRRSDLTGTDKGFMARYRK